MFYYSVVNLLRIVIHYSNHSLTSPDPPEWPRQTKPKKGQFMNSSQGHSGTKVQCESCLFSQGKTPEFTKMGEIHELFVLALSLVWFAGATPDTDSESTANVLFFVCRGPLGIFFGWSADSYPWGRLDYPLARNQYINNSPGIFSCIRTGANTGATCIRTEMNSLKNLATMRKMVPQKYFPVFARKRIQAPHVFVQKLIPQEIFPACIGFVPGGTFVIQNLAKV